ncbi:GTPase-associated system all-helical protein GASH [Nocardioides litoris]|uniref:GTPase-associated system all-helical protein GASH n=1 Tax=Nocardioides litoris TaxID=1926648 RepID=UPI00111E81CE|nr:GTPase-associated system all-helical protein GASH [Nocardioides litoris]
MRPALTRLDAVEFERCAAWVAALSESDADLGTLVLAAHAELPQRLLAELEQHLVTADVGYVPGGKKALVSRLAACVLMGLMGDDDQDSAAAGLFIRSAAFVGLAPTIAELPEQAHACVRKAGVNVRRRPTLAPVAPKRRKSLERADSDSVTVAELKSELALRDSTISALQRRVDQLIASQHAYTSMVEEEVDALWWANSASSWLSGEVWADIHPLDRGVLAGLEIGSLLRLAPMAPAHALLLRSVTSGSDADARFGIVEIAAAVSARSAAHQARDGESALLRPLNAAAVAHQQVDNDREREQALAESLNLDDTWSKSALEVAEQLLVEKSLEMIV